MARFGRIILVMLALVIAVAAPSYIMRKALLEWAIIEALSSQGVADAQLKVTLAQSNVIKIDGVRLGPRLAAQSLSIFFTPSGLMEGRVEEVNLTGLDMDVSEPKAGILGLLMKGETKPAEQALEIPQINLFGALIRGSHAGADFSVMLDGAIAPDLTTTFEFAAEGLDGQLLNGRLAGKPKMDGAKLASVKADISGDVYSPWAAPSGLSGAISYTSDGEIAFKMNVVAINGGGRLAVKGKHDLAKGKGSAELDLPPVVFKEGGLQPNDLSPLAASFNVTGSVTGAASVSWQAGRIGGKAHADLSQLSLVLDGVEVKDLSATFDAAMAENNTIEAKVKIARALVDVSGRTFAISDADATADISLAHMAIDYNLARAEVAVDDDSLGLSPLIVKGKGRLQEKALTFKGSGQFTEGGAVSGAVDVGADFTWQGTGQFQADLKGVSFAVGDIAVNGLSAKLNVPDLNLDEEIKVKISEGRTGIKISDHWLFLQGLAANVVVNPETMAITATLSTGTLNHDSLKPFFKPASLQGEADLKQDVLNFKGRASFLKRKDGGGDILVKGTHDLNGGEGRAGIDISPVMFFPTGPFPSDFSALAAGLENANGIIRGAAEIHWAGAAFDGSADLNLDNLSFKVGTTEVAGLTGTLHLDGLNPPYMKEIQKISASQITDAISLNDPELNFRLKKEQGQIHLAHAEVGMLSGLFSIDDAHLDFYAPVNKVTVKVSNMDLAKLMKLLDLEGVSGSGVVNGAVPLEIREDSIVVNDGLMEASGPGVLRIRSEQAKQALAGGGEQVEMLLKVLDDFHYKRLDLRVNNDANGEAVIRLGTEGRNPVVLDGFPFILNINLSTNLNKIFAMLLDVYRFSKNAVKAATHTGK